MEIRFSSGAMFIAVSFCLPARSFSQSLQIVLGQLFLGEEVDTVTVDDIVAELLCQALEGLPGVIGHMLAIGQEIPPVLVFTIVEKGRAKEEIRFIGKDFFQVFARIGEVLEYLKRRYHRNGCDLGWVRSFIAQGEDVLCVAIVVVAVESVVATVAHKETGTRSEVDTGAITRYLVFIGEGKCLMGGLD